MNERDHDFGTLDLEDIIKEFGGGEPAQPEIVLTAAEPVEPETEEVPAEPEVEEPQTEETYAEEPEMNEEPVETDPQPQEEPESPAPEDTVRLDDLSRATMPRGEEAAEETVQDEAAEEVVEVAPEEIAEAPETLGAAMADDEDEDDEIEVNFPHLPPLIFRPRSRLGELKRQLVAGPEKRYYELAEIGVGKVQIAMLLCLVVILVSGIAALLYNAGQVPDSRIRLMVFSQVLAMLMGGLLGSQQMVEGIGDIFQKKFTLNTMLAITFVACCVDSVFCFMEERVPLCAAFTLEVAMSLWSAYHKRSTEMGRMDTMRKAVRLDGVAKCEDYHDGRTGFLRKEGQVEEFMDHYDETGGPERLQMVYAFIALLACIGVAVVAGMFHGISMAFQIFSTAMLVAIPASMFITLTRPAAILEKRLHGLGTVLCGWSGVKGLCSKGVIPLRDYDLFPAGATKMNGVKFYGDRDLEEVIAYAAALMNGNGGSLDPIFQQLLDSRGGVHYTAENLQYYGNGGIGGEVCGEPVLMGTLEFLKDMGVEVPDGTQVRQAVYVSIDGELSGLFAITYTRTKFAANGLATLHHYRRVQPVLLTKDFMLTAPFLKEKFGVRNRRMIFPTRQEQEILEQKQPDAEAPSLALLTQEGLAPVAYAITGARALRTASRLGMAVHMVGGILGLLIMMALAVLGAAHLLTPVHILFYQLVWMLPGLLITMWPRTI